VGDNEFDASDLDEGLNYLSNIEPTLGVTRVCYFELPRDLVTNSFILRFGGFLAEKKDVDISISYPQTQSAPAPASVPVAETRPVTNVVSAITKNRWTADSLIVSGTLTNSSAIAVQITGMDARGFDEHQEMITGGSDYTITNNELAPGETVNFKVALKDDAKKVKFVRVLPSWSP
jgi:hypothetical protein